MHSLLCHLDNVSISLYLCAADLVSMSMDTLPSCLGYSTYPLQALVDIVHDMPGTLTKRMASQQHLPYRASCLITAY